MISFKQRISILLVLLDLTPSDCFLMLRSTSVSSTEQHLVYMILLTCTVLCGIDSSSSCTPPAGSAIPVDDMTLEKKDPRRLQAFSEKVGKF